MKAQGKEIKLIGKLNHWMDEELDRFYKKNKNDFKFGRTKNDLMKSFQARS